MVKKMELQVVKIEMPKECNVVLGMAHFIKTVEDLYEALVNSVPNIKFGIGVGMRTLFHHFHKKRLSH